MITEVLGACEAAPGSESGAVGSRERRLSSHRGPHLRGNAKGTPSLLIDLVLV